MIELEGRKLEYDDDKDCIHGLPLDIPCTICSGKDVSKELPEELGLIIGAKYPGQCRACDLPIMEGQLIVHTSRYGGAWIHNDCFGP